MLLQSVMAKTHFAQRRGEASGFAASERSQSPFIKKFHHTLKQAKTDLQPFLTVYGTGQRAFAKEKRGEAVVLTF
jgi:hypothetical protein